ncbi:hypothetical protein C0J52_02910 [Blattella germanica]|nr:hypothetical protein C0J52_02910 [Blattella germanica]
MEGPGFCWYLLQPDTGQRVEIQVHRLVSVGRFNGTSCQAGFLQLVDGAEPRPRPGDSQICGSNERFSPPVVLFADRGSATLLFHIGEPTLRSQFLALFSFTPTSSTQGTGFQPRGGRRIEHTECDWLYQDFSCRDPGSCVLASPGYPGLYPPNRQCNHCGTDYIAIYQGSTPSSHLLTTLCANRKGQLQYSGPNLLIEFRSPSCQSVVEIYDGPAEEGVKPAKRICSPLTKHARDPSGRFLEQQTFVSSDNMLTVVLRRLGPPPRNSENSDSDAEFLDGAFLFHDEQVDGTLQPDTFCDVDYYGLSSSLDGWISNPGTQHLFWNIEGSLRCTQRFIPAANQSVTITVSTLARLSPDPHCHTQCGDGGCHCVANLLPLSQMDHLLLVTDAGQAVSCLCGDFQVTTMAACEIHSRNVSAPSTLTLNYYYHQECTWLLDSKVERQLTVELATNQNRPCTAWNVSVHQYEENRIDGVGQLLHTFCPRDRSKEYSLPWKMNTVLLRLQAMTRTLPEYAIRWNSQILNLDMLGLPLLWSNSAGSTLRLDYSSYMEPEPIKTLAVTMVKMASVLPYG